MTRRCFSDHMGAWAIEPRWLRQALAAIQGGAWRPESAVDVRPVLRPDELTSSSTLAGFAAVPGSGMIGGSYAAPVTLAQPGALWPNGDRPAWAHDYRAAHGGGEAGPAFQLVGNGIALVTLHGPMMKQRSKFGGTSTLDARRAIREASASRDVRGILLHVDSPGGHVAGTLELASDVAAARRRKPVHAFIEDLGASAAYWAASQAARVSVNPTGLVGSIGTVAVLYDESERFEANGVKVHVVSTGDHKGAGVPGSVVTPEHVEATRELVEDLNGHFLEAVARGRKMGARKLEAVSDGRVHVGRKALELGLVDAVEDVDAAVRELEEVAAQRAQRGRTGAFGAVLVDEPHRPAPPEGATLEARELEDDELSEAERLEARRKAAQLRRRRLELEG